jgi:hypothetical protein
MADEISWANLETHGGLAHYLEKRLHTNLYDPTDLRRLMPRREFTPGMGSETAKTTKVTRGQTFDAASTEISGGGSNKSIGAGNFQHTVSRRYMKWQVSDLWRLVSVNGSIDLDLLADVIDEAAGLTCTDILCSLFTSLAATAVGSTTGEMVVDYMYDAQYELNDARVPTPYAAVLFPHCFNMFQDSARSEGGVVQWQAATADMIAAKGPGFKGLWGGIEVWDSDSVNSDGGTTYKLNAMFGYGCFEYMEAPPIQVSDALPANVVKITDNDIRIVHAYDADNALTTIYGDYYPSVVEAEDLRGIEIHALL